MSFVVKDVFMDIWREFSSSWLSWGLSDRYESCNEFIPSHWTEESTLQGEMNMKLHNSFSTALACPKFSLNAVWLQ